MHLALESPHGSALLEVSKPKVRAWLDRTYALVSEEAERAHGPSDAELTELLSGGR